MKKHLFFLPTIALLAILLGGCTGSEEENGLALELRGDFLSAEGWSGSMEVTADYGQRVYDYSVTFSGTRDKGLTLVLTAPEEVAGITAVIKNGGTGLTFDGVQLETGPLNEQGLSPLDALPAFLTAVESGYIAESGSELLGEIDTLRLCCREVNQEVGEGIETVLWFDKETKALLQGELRSDGATVIRCLFTGFSLTMPPSQ